MLMTACRDRNGRQHEYDASMPGPHYLQRRSQDELVEPDLFARAVDERSDGPRGRLPGEFARCTLGIKRVRDRDVAPDEDRSLLFVARLDGGLRDREPQPKLERIINGIGRRPNLCGVVWNIAKRRRQTPPKLIESLGSRVAGLKIARQRAQSTQQSR
jgi:hypothetical protein